MIETEKDKAIVTYKPQKENLRYWLDSKDWFLLTVEKSEWEINDAVIFTDGRKKTEIEQVEVLRSRMHNQHQNWANAGKSLKQWSNGPFHAGNPLIMATWLLSKAGVSEILFAEVKAEDTIDHDFERKTFRKLMKKLKSEFEIEIKYNNKESQLFGSSGGTYVPPKNLEEVDPIEIPKEENIFESFSPESHKKTVIKYKGGSVGPTVVFQGESSSYRFTSTDLIPNDISRIPEPNLFILNPDENLKKAVTVTNNEKGLYLVNEDVEESVLQAEQSVYMKTFLSFAVGELPVRTQGVISRVGEDERQKMKAIAKGKDITHV